MKFILDLADTLSQPQVEQLVVSNGWTLLQTFEGLGNTVLVESSSEITAGGDIESAVRDDTAPIQLLTSFSLDQPTVIDTIQANDLNSWWKTFTVNEVDHNQPDFSLPRRGWDGNLEYSDSLHNREIVEERSMVFSSNSSTEILSNKLYIKYSTL
jgi:hypothetical protein